MDRRTLMAIVSLSLPLVVSCGTSKVKVNDTAGSGEIPDVAASDAADANAGPETLVAPDGAGDIPGEDVCQPDCAGKECGDDGCGGSCGCGCQPCSAKLIPDIVAS